jgi:hypothetical protein
VNPKARKDDTGYDGRVVDTFVAAGRIISIPVQPDSAALRSYLVDEEFMQRRRVVYWRTGSVANGGYDPPGWPLE